VDPVEKLWRIHLAYLLRSFRRVKGRWPDKDIVASAKRGLSYAVKEGIKPIVYN
jgi:hypothetical protein